MTIETRQAPPEPVHLVALSGIHTLDGKIRYACEHNRFDLTTPAVREWLARYHVDTEPSYVTTVIGEWLRAHGGLTPGVCGNDPSAVTTQPQPSERKPAGAWGFYGVAFLSMLVSVDTSWRFFGEVLHVTDSRERAVMFTVLEVALVACGYGMRANVRRTGRPGAPRLIAWVLCGLAAYMAWQLSGLGAGIARVALGPALSLVMLHLALGIEIRAGQHKTGTWTRVGREVRERVLSRLGLADDTRDALARTRDRAVARAARLALAGRWTPLRRTRTLRALRAGNVSHDVSARARLLADLATARHASELGTLSLPSPWHIDTGVHSSHEAADDTSQEAPKQASGEVLHDVSRPAGDTGRVSPAAHTRTPRATRVPRSSTAGKAKGRPSREEYLARARAALADSEPVTMTAKWVQAAVPGISRSMSYVIVDALSAEPTSTSADTSVDGAGQRAMDGAVDSVRGPGPNGPVDGAVDVSVDTDRALSVNGDAR